MKEITVAQLRQNPTAALAEVEAGETYVVTRHRRPIARLSPPDAAADSEALRSLVPASNPHPSALSSRPTWRLKTAGSVDELLADLRSER